MTKSKLTKKKMKILLVNPAQTVYEPCKVPHLGLGYLGAVMEKKYDVKAVDLNIESESKFIRSAKESDVVCFTATTMTISGVLKLVWLTKMINRKCKIILGGPHPTAVPIDVIKHLDINFVVVGEGEITLMELLDAIENDGDLKNVNGIVFKNENRVVVTEPRPYIENLDSLPFPAYHLFPDLDKYTSYQPHINKKSGGIMTSRGCPFNCVFCLHPNTKIITDKGTSKISEITKNTKVLTNKGSFQKVLSVMKHPYNDFLVVIQPHYNNIPLKVTPNHKIFALKQDMMKSCHIAGGKCRPGHLSKECPKCEKKHYLKYIPSKVRADSLKKGDFVIFPTLQEVRDIKKIKISDIIDIPSAYHKRGKSYSKETIEKIIKLGESGLSTRKIARQLNLSSSSVAQYIKKDREGKMRYKFPITIILENGFIKYKRAKKSVRNEIPVTNDFLRLVGYYLAEGCVIFNKSRPNSTGLSFTFSENEETYVKDVITTTKKIFKITPRKYHNKVNKTYQISANSTILAHFFNKLFGSHSNNKKLPDSFIYLPPKKQEALICGLFRGDGGLTTNSKRLLCFTTASKKLMEQLIIITPRLKITPSTYKILPYEGTKNKQIIYRIDVSGGTDIDKIREILKVDIPYSKKTYKYGFSVGNFSFVPIRKIYKEKYTGKVYNLSVENIHSYTANRMAVSNCFKSLWGRSFRARSPENVVKEWKWLIDDLKVEEIAILDDVFNLDMKRANKIYDLILKEHLEIPHLFPNGLRCDFLNRELLTKMKKVGVFRLAFGVETGSKRIMDTLGKNLKFNAVRKTFKLCKEMGIETVGFFILGLPGENRETMQKTIDFAKELDPTFAQFTCLSPYPGTKVYDLIKKEGELIEDWNVHFSGHFDYGQRSFKLGEVTPELLDEMRKRAYREFYFRPSYLLKHLRHLSIKNIKHVLYYMRG